MFVKLENGIHINVQKIMSIEPQEEDYSIKMLSGQTISLSSEYFPWLAKICGFLIQLKSGVVINTMAIVSIVPRGEAPILTLEDGSSFALTQTEALSLMQRSECLSLEDRVQFLKSKHVSCEDYRKL